MQVCVNGKCFSAKQKGGAAKAGISLVRSLANSDKVESIDVYIPTSRSMPPPKFNNTKILIHSHNSWLFNYAIGRAIWEQIVFPLVTLTHRNTVIFNPANTFSMILALFRRKNFLLLHDAGSSNSTWFTMSFSIYNQIMIQLIKISRINVITVSQSARGEIAKKHQIEKPIHVITNGIDISQKQTNEPTSKYGEFLLCLGANNPRKNHACAIKAFKLLKADFPELSLVIAGPAKGIFKESEDYKRDGIIPLGYVSEDTKWQLLSTASALLFPSFEEGYGLPIGEALSVGTTVIASELDVFKEIYGENITYANPHSPEEFAQAYKETRKTKKTSTSYTPKTWDKTAKEYIDLFSGHKQNET